jgi:hypothetical protein
MERARYFRLAPACLALAGAAALAVFDPATTWWFPSCPLYAWTGWQCPLCGSLRAVHALLHAAPLASLSFNPLILPALGLWLIGRDRTVAWCFSARALTVLAMFGLLRNL